MSARRPPRRVRHARRQRGQSLIGVMVGLLISLLTIAAMVAIYALMIDVSGNTARSAQRDGQLASALLTAQIEMQRAGFGVPPGEAGAFAILDDGRLVVWRYSLYPDAGEACAGLRIVDDAASTAVPAAPADADADRRGLYWLPAQPCTSADAPPAWSATGAAAPRRLLSATGFFVPQDRQGHALADEAGVRSLQNARFQRDGECSLPYAQQAGLLDVSQRVSLKVAGEVVFSACLSNLKAAG
ncbi:PilW family protein [Luteimonas huabeiensis]|uniref:PilW family protein n=1 Tax=Luteimonas huabeiensis TaxID=1244513 RepID=UPI0004B185A8|nr:hypothetical protein [Luteimonas huabeiensis]